MDVKPVKIEGTLFWAFLNRKNINDCYSVDIGNLDDGDIAKLRSIGVEPRFNPKKPDQGHFITCKSKNYPIKAYEINGDELDINLANGSKAKALIGVYDWTYKGKKGVSPSIKKLVVTEPIEYKPANNLDDDEDDDL